MAIAVLFVTINGIGAGDAMAESGSVAKLASNSSRRGSSEEPPAPTEHGKANSEHMEDVQLDSSDKGTAGSDNSSPIEDMESTDEFDVDADDKNDREKSENAGNEVSSRVDADQLDKIDSPKPRRLSEMKLINTDTRLLRVNIAETDLKSPADQSSELIAQGLSHTSILPSEKRFAWAAPDIRYQPLYFEDVALERYGQTPCGCELRQTALSAAHFFKSAALLPYQMIEQDPHSCDWPLGFCRPGTDAPFVWQKHINP